MLQYYASMILVACTNKDTISTGSSKLSIMLGKWLTLENEKKNCCSQDWRHKKEKPSYQSFSLMVSYQKVYIGPEYIETIL